MTTIVLKRQLITDAVGNPVGIILPLAEYAAVAEILKRQFPSTETDEKHKLTEQPALPPVRESAYFGMWADREDLQDITSRDWPEALRQKTLS